MELKRASGSVDAFVQALAPAQRKTVEAARAAVRAAAPELAETVRWGLPVYAGRSNVLALLVYEEEVHLALFEGARLTVTRAMLERTGAKEAPYLLQGVGDRVRFLRLRGARDVEPQTVAELVREAVRLDGGADRPS